MSRLPEASPMPTSMPVHDVDAWPTLGPRSLAFLAAVGLWLLGSLFTSAHASNISWSIGINVPAHGYGGQHHRPGAVYSTPGYPAVVYPQPVYRQPSHPVVVYGAPVYVYPPASVGYGRPSHPHASHHGRPHGQPHWDDRPRGPHGGYRDHRDHRGEERWHDGGRWQRH